ncbi:MAG: Minf_1886 family protein [Planctomycetota bacterium]|nr:Minf_1886 family protein [Planctomycetota bacterium]
MKPEFATKMKSILEKDDRYDLRAYALVNEALARAIEKRGKREHISAKNLVEGFSEAALDRYGNMARMVLEEWGVYRSDDIGEIVFNLVDAGIFARQNTDSKLDFIGLLNFTSAFDEAEVKW